MARDGSSTGGRPKGSANKCTIEARALVDRICKKLKDEKKLTPEDLSVALLTCGDNGVIQRELGSLRAYRYGRPVQPITGENGGPIGHKIVIESYIERPLRIKKEVEIKERLQ